MSDSKSDFVPDLTADLSKIDTLAEARQRIDDIDERVQQLIAARACVAQRVGEIKTAAGEGGVFYRPEREAQILRTIAKRNEGPLEDATVQHIFREIISACLALETPLTVAYLGPAGSYTEAAATERFGSSVELVPLRAIDEVFREVEAKAAHYGVVPIENSTEGVVTHTLDMFVTSKLTICGEIKIAVHHNLLSNATDLDQVKRVYAHGQALAQCREWLDANLPHAEQIPVASNTEGALRARDDANAAAIAGKRAAGIYELRILQERIEDHPDNTTRFLVIGNQDVGASGEDMTSILVSAPNKAGALHALLEPFAKHGVSMTRIESRPSRRVNWDYHFFIDVEGHKSHEGLQRALADIEGKVTYQKILGSYPKA